MFQYWADFLPILVQRGKILNINSQPVKVAYAGTVDLDYSQWLNLGGAFLEIKTQKGENFVINKLKTKNKIIFTNYDATTRIIAKGFYQAFAKAKKCYFYGWHKSFNCI